MVKNYVVVDKGVLKILGKRGLIDIACDDRRTHKTRTQASKLSKKLGNATTIKLPKRCYIKR